MKKADHFKATSNSCQFGFLRPLFQYSPQSRLGECEVMVWRHSHAGLSLLALMFLQVKWYGISVPAARFTVPLVHGQQQRQSAVGCHG